MRSIARLAEAHCVYSGILTERIIASVIKKKYSSANLHKIYTYTGALNGIGVMANDIVFALELLTKQNNLSTLTFTKWSKILPSRYLLHHYRTWCPLCYDEWNQRKHLIYEPLIWTLKLIKVCPIHQIPLQQKCPHCHQFNFLLSWRSRPAYCSRCFKWLGHSHRHLIDDFLIFDTDLDWHIWVANNIEMLLSVELNVSAINISDSLNKIVDKFTKGNIAALARFLKMPKNTVWLWCKGKNQPSIEALLTICYRLKINLVDLLINTHYSPIVSIDFPKTSSIVLTSRKNPTFNALYIQQKLLEILNQSETPPRSLEEVARDLSCHRRTIYKHFPELCR